jgi:uncharacterized protein (DUF1684 family)
MRAVVLSSILAAGCGAAAPSTRAGAELDAWNAWRESRRESIAGENGWITLIGLHWLDEGETTLGSDPGSGIVLPADRAPAHVGTLVLEGGAVVFVPSAGAAIEGVPVTERTGLVADDPGPATTVEVGSLRMHVIARSDRRGLRVKDRESPARASFEGIRVFDYDPALRLRARVVPPAEGETIPIVNVLGMETEEPLLGRVELEVSGERVTLLATDGGDGTLFVMFRDATSDEGETYGAGRYLDVAPPDASGETWVDFNYAYTPPCGFTEHATCPLAPPENTIPVAIRAGERSPSGHPQGPSTEE